MKTMSKNLNILYTALLLTLTFSVHAQIPFEQDKDKLLETYQHELRDLKTKVTQLETEVFIGGYHDLIERYQLIIKQLEHDIEQANSGAITYSHLNQKIVILQAEINDLSSSLSWNSFYLLISMFLSALAVMRAKN